MASVLLVEITELDWEGVKVRVLVLPPGVSELDWEGVKVRVLVLPPGISELLLDGTADDGIADEEPGSVTVITLPEVGVGITELDWESVKVRVLVLSPGVSELLLDGTAEDWLADEEPGSVTVITLPGVGVGVRYEIDKHSVKEDEPP